MRREQRLLFILFCVAFCGRVVAQEAYTSTPVTLSLADAEKLFMKNNFSLLAAKYHLTASEAAVAQSKIYPNPTLSIDQGLYNQDTKKWADLSSTGETAASLQQLIILAGKRNKQIDIAKINSQIAAYQFYDLLRTLRYTLRSSFYALYFLAEPLAVYDREIASLINLVDEYNTQYNKGNIAFKEVARLQALLFSLQNERIGLLSQAAENQENLALLTGDTLSRKIIPLADSTFFTRVNDNVYRLRLEELIDSGMANRYDLKTANTTVELNKANYNLQKALRVPDLTLGLNYDKAGSYVRNYNSISVAFDLPIRNRNKGNITQAQFQIEESKSLRSQAEWQVRNDITKAYTELLNTQQLYSSTSAQFTKDYEKLLDGILKGYENHTISLLEFIDYYETYKNSKIEFNHLQNNRMEALENLNLATGTIILK